VTTRPRLGRSLAAGTALTALAVGGLGAGHAIAVPTTTLTVSSADTPRAIPDAADASTPGTVTSSITVSGAAGVVQDLDLTTGIQHGFGPDLEVLLTSPSGTTVPITTRNPRDGEDQINVFDGTVWDDGANDPVTIHTGFADNVLASPLTPEGAMGAFTGETANGVWTLTIRDLDPGVAGTLREWRLRLALADPPPAAVAEPPAVQEADTTIPERPVTGPPVPATSTIVIDPAGPAREIQDVDVVTGIRHTATRDLFVRLRSPRGTAVVLAANRGFDTDDAYDGTVWDDDAGAATPPGRTRPVSDESFTTVPLGSAVPEGAMAAFMGEDPRGTWTLEVADTALADTGTIDRWELRLSTVATPAPPGPTPPPVPPDAVIAEAADVCLPAPKPLARPAVIRRPMRVTLAQLRINQRVSQAAVRRANAIQAWLDAGLAEGDLCGGAIGTRELGEGIRVGILPAKQVLAAPSPRPIVETQAAGRPRGLFHLNAAQLLINQRIAQAAVRRANALEARLAGGLTGGDVRDGAIGQGKLELGLAIASATALATPPAPSRTIVASGNPAGDPVRLSAAQLLVNQRIGPAAVRRLNRLRATLETGVPGTAFRPDSLTAVDLAPALRAP
jgi:subtilisin-like proprotein convertase family protein